MDRNTVIGFILIAGIFIIFSVLNKPSEEEIAKQRRYQDSMARVEALEAERQAEQDRLLRQEQEQEQQPVQQEVPDSVRKQALQDQFGAFGNAATGEDEMITLENDLVKLQIVNKGGRIYSAELKDYKTYNGEPLILFSGDSTIFSLNFFAQRRSIATGDLYFQPQTSEKTITADNEMKSVTMRLQAGEGKYIDYTYTLEPESYMVDFDVNIVGLGDVIDQNISSIDLYWEMYAPALERGEEAINNYSTIYYKHYQDEVEHFRGRSNKEVQEESIPTRLRWVAFKNQFFSTALIADESFQNAEVMATEMPGPEYMQNFRAEIGIPLEDPNSTSIPMQFYLGPNHYNTLKKFEGLELQSLVDVGGFLSKFINRLIIIPIFNFLNNFIGNYGIIILLLTIIIKMALFPLTYRSYLSQAKMRVLKPQIDAINEKIPKDKAMERQQATMNLYRKAGVNPVGGCLPMLLQMPILIAMFRFFPASIELRQESFLWAHDLSTYDAIIEWSAQIPLVSKYFGNHISLFTLLMTVTTVISMRMSNTTTTSAQMPGMKGMMYMMPVMFMFILNSFSAGLTYYYFLANVITIGQNAIFKNSINEEALLKKLEAKKAKPVKKSSFQKRLEDMQKQRGGTAPKRKR